MKTVIRSFVLISLISFLIACSGGKAGYSAANLLSSEAPGGSGSVSISWTAPTVNVDGSPAIVAGYNIYRRTRAPRSCPTDISRYSRIPPVPASNLATIVGSPPEVTFIDTGLAAGKYCYAVTALDIHALESVPVFLAARLKVR